MKPVITVSFIVHDDYSHIRCALTSLFSESQIPLKVYVTINSGTPDELAKLKSDFPQVVYLVNEHPKGFAENHNQVMRLAKTPYVALLNDDIELAPAMLDHLVAYLEQNPLVGLVTPRVLNPDGTPQLTAFNDPSLFRVIYKVSGFGHWTRQGSLVRNLLIRSGIAHRLGVASLDNRAITREVPVAIGVAMVVRRTAYQEGGLMDENTIIYGEEVAWHWRLRQAGWKIMVVAETFVTHFNVDKDLQGWRLAEHRKGMLNYYCLYRPHWQSLVIRTAMILFHGVRGCFNLLFDHKRAIGDWLAIRLAVTWKPAKEN